MAAGTYSLSVYAQAAGRTRIILQVIDGSANPNATFDLTALTTSAITGGTATIVDAGNGWRRCTLMCALVAAPVQIIIYLDNGAGGSYLGDGVSGVCLWGAQLELGAFATSYRPTVASSVTRTADSLVVASAQFVTFYNQAEGTILYSGNTLIQNANTFMSINNGTVANNIYLSALGSNNGQINFVSVDASALQVRSCVGRSAKLQNIHIRRRVAAE